MSTTIHVTIPDHTQALAVVSTLLNQGYQVSIDLDVVPSFTEPNYMDSAEVKIREQLWDDDQRKLRELAVQERVALSKHVANFTEHSVYGTKVGFDGSDYYINGMKVSENKFRKEMQMRAAAADERAMKAAEAIERVGCAKCGATQGERCVTSGNNSYGSRKVHLDREMALIELYRGDEVKAGW